MKKFLYIGLGLLALAMGTLGLVLPVLPTTPFLLLAAFCFLRSSERLYEWLIHHRLFGSYIQNYIIHKAVRRKVKIGTLVFLWISLGISALLVKSLPVRLLLPAVGVGVSIHILKLKTL